MAHVQLVVALLERIIYSNDSRENACIVRNGALISTTLNLKKQNEKENEGPGTDGRRKASPLPLWFRVKRQIRGICVQARIVFQSLVTYTMENRLLVAKTLCVAMAWIVIVYSLPIEFAAVRFEKISKIITSLDAKHYPL